MFGVDVQQGVELIGYADDLAMLVTAKRREELQFKANIALPSVTKWIEGKELRVDPNNTEVVVLAGRRKVKEVVVVVKDRDIRSKRPQQERIGYVGKPQKGKRGGRSDQRS